MAYPGLMRALPSATMLCRVLIGLDRASASGTLHLEAEGRRATMLFRSGELVAANIDRRVAISHRQVLEQVFGICQWSGLLLRLLQSDVALDSSSLRGERLRARTLALETMRAAVKRVEIESLRAQLGNATYHLTDAGEAMLCGAELRPEETALLFGLRRGVPAEDLALLPCGGLIGHRFLWTLKVLGGASPKLGGSFPLLLRKHRELRRRASAHALLDLPEGAGGRDARVALRKLVRELHPDRFGDGTPAALRRASGEITTALVNAEAQIVSGRAK